MNRLARSTLLLAVFFGLDKVVALGRQVIIARLFGVSPALDAYNAANNVPDLLFALISGGALSIAFIPVLSEYVERQDRAGLWELFSRVANLAFVVTAVFAVVVAVFAGPLVRWELGIAPGFDSQQQELVAGLMRLNLIATLIFSISGLVIAGLHANQHFLLPALAPILYNVGLIFGAACLAPSEGLALGPLRLPGAGLGIHGLVYGVILGAVLHLGVQIPGLLRHGFRWTPRIQWSHPGLRRVVRLMGPRVLTLGAVQVIFLATDNLASRLDPGAVSALAYGWLIMQVPETVIGTAIATALLPTLSEMYARGDRDGVRTALADAVRMMLALTVPAALGLMFLVRPLVQLVFRFDARATELVALAAQMFLLGLVGHSLLEITARAFYARKDARTPLVAALGAMAVFVALAAALFRVMGHAGIALANSTAFTLQAFGLLILLLRRERDVDSLPLRDGLWRVAAASALMGLTLAGFAHFGDGLGSVAQLLVGGGLAGLVYAGAAWAVKLKEIRQLPVAVTGGQRMVAADSVADVAD